MEKVRGYRGDIQVLTFCGWQHLYSIVGLKTKIICPDFSTGYSKLKDATTTSSVEVADFFNFVSSRVRLAMTDNQKLFAKPPSYNKHKAFVISNMTSHSSLMGVTFPVEGYSKSAFEKIFSSPLDFFDDFDFVFMATVSLIISMGKFDSKNNRVKLVAKDHEKYSEIISFVFNACKVMSFVFELGSGNKERTIYIYPNDSLRSIIDFSNMSIKRFYKWCYISSPMMKLGAYYGLIMGRNTKYNKRNLHVIYSRNYQIIKLAEVCASYYGYDFHENQRASMTGNFGVTNINSNIPIKVNRYDGEIINNHRMEVFQFETDARFSHLRGCPYTFGYVAGV